MDLYFLVFSLKSTFCYISELKLFTLFHPPPPSPATTRQNDIWLIKGDQKENILNVQLNSIKIAFSQRQTTTKTTKKKQFSAVDAKLHSLHEKEEEFSYF
jgi:hypothetical protein